ncbi:MAG: DUF4249 domain-containing protein [Muribaculaceae bacterium]|nr:DUF4249 domain-containing protein [Muribaculaceae bacterium]
MKKRYYIPFLFLSGWLSSCEEEVAHGLPMPVIEGTISSEGYPTVLFSSSIVPGTDGNLQDAMINWGKVTISDGEREVVLTGSADASYLPPFRYHTVEMTGEPGKTYTITAKFKDLYAVSTCRLPDPTAIDSITFSASSDSLRAATLFFHSPEDVPAYYYLTMRQPKRDSRDAPCMMGTIRVDSPNKGYSIPVLRPRVKVDSVKYQSQLMVGEEWIVSLNRVEREVYEFWKAYDNMVLFSTSPFLSVNESLPTNIRGGYGVWSPQGRSSKIIRVE